MHTSLKLSPGLSLAQLLILRDVQILRRSLWVTPGLFLFFPVWRKDGSKRIKDFPPYSTTWIFRNTNVLQRIRHLLTEQCLSTQTDYRRQQFCGMPQIQVRKYLNLTSHPCLSMGWALESSHVRRTRFTEKQKDYLTSKFGTGQTTGHKADAASVANSMMTASDSNGNRFLTSSEFLTGQVSSQGQPPGAQSVKMTK